MASMNAPTLDQIVAAVLAWQHRHPLAERLSSQAVHSIGLVALPFLRAQAPEEAGPPVPSWRRLLTRLQGGRLEGAGHAAFSEQFIEGLPPRRAAAFALRHGTEQVEGADDWPQRRIEVDDAAALAGGWPFERWLLSAAIEGRQGRGRVLVSLDPPLQVLGRRLLDRRRVFGLALPLVGVAGAALWLTREPPPDPPELSVSGALQPASAASATSSGATPSAESASRPASEVFGTAPAPDREVPPIDIRPHLGPPRPATSHPPATGPAAPPAEAPVAAAETSASAPLAPSAGTADPERVGPRLPAQGPVVALVGPVLPKREDAEALLARMREHLGQSGAGDLQGEVFAQPGGYRAAIWPFASREEAQLINATMVARGWRTRAVDF